MTIQILPSEIADQIAAGEVVERPASVIKELIENSLDAGANKIIVRVNDGGKELLEVEDDGSGMSMQDAEKSILRHATSKIKSIDDLFAVSTFGFRGEALAAISSVSEFELLTKKSAENFGTLLTVSGGKHKQVTSAAANTGTKITIKRLFFPTPARLKHLKNSATEFTHIYKEFLGFALANPTVSFEIWKDDKLYKQLPSQEEEIRILQLLGKKEAEVLKISADFSGMKIRGQVIQPGLCARTRKQQFFFVNGRRIEDFRLAHAVREAYLQSAGIEKHLHPVFVLFLEIDPILVDVNVHPRKLEVKFSEPRDVYSLVKSSVMAGLQSSKMTAFADPMNSRASFHTLRSPHTPTPSNSAPSRSVPRDFQSSLTFSAPRSFSAQSFERDAVAAPVEPQVELSELKLIGQVANKYIVAQANTGVYFFDQHALHERQRFEIFWNQYQDQKIRGNFLQQKLLIPEKTKLTLEETSVLFEEHNRRVLEKLGFSLQLIDDERFEILAVPQLLEGENMSEVLADFAQNFLESNFAEHAIDQLMRKKLEYKSCRGAVMFGDSLEPVEMQKLLDDFMTTQWRNLCPHGRPNHWLIPFDELDQRFHR